MKFFLRILLVVSTLLLSACASNKFTSAQTLVKNTSLKNSTLYVYSFLDIREEEFGPELLWEFNTQFKYELAKSGTKVKVLRFKDSETGKYTALTASSAPIPVKEVIAQNEREEKSFGADYRMVIFPSTMHNVGSARHYNIRWDLYSTRTGNMVWSATSRGKHADLLIKGEQSEERARQIVEGAIAEMQKSGLLQSGAAEPSGTDI